MSAIDLEQQALPDSLARFELDGEPSQFEASQWQVAAHRSALDAERRSLNVQLTSQPARSRVRRAQRDELVQSIELQQRNLAQLDLALASRRHSQSDLALQSTIAGYSTGIVTVLDVLDSERVLLSVRLGLAQLVSDYMKSLAEMERAIGAPFPQGNP